MVSEIKGDITDDLEELTDLKDILIEEVDPLFGNFESNKDLLNFLSPTKKTKKRVNESRPT